MIEGSAPYDYIIAPFAEGPAGLSMNEIDGLLDLIEANNPDARAAVFSSDWPIEKAREQMCKCRGAVITVDNEYGKLAGEIGIPNHVLMAKASKPLEEQWHEGVHMVLAEPGNNWGSWRMNELLEVMAGAEKAKADSLLSSASVSGTP